MTTDNPAYGTIGPEDQTASDGHPLTAELQTHPLFRTLSAADRARLLPSISAHVYHPGEVIVERGAPVKALYWLQQGEIGILPPEGDPRPLTVGSFAQDLALGRATHLYQVRAARRPARVLAIDAASLSRLLPSYPELRDSLVGDFIAVVEGSRPQSPAAPDGPVRQAAREWNAESIKPVIGWLAALLLPVLLYWGLDEQVPEDGARTFLAAFSASVVLWIFRLIPDYIAGFLVVLVVLVTDIAPSSVILGGFQSPSFFMALAVFVLAAVLVSSGVMYRLSLLLLRHTPNNVLSYNLSMVMAGLLLTPVLPSVNGRISITMPLLDDMIHGLGFRPNGTAATRLAVSTFFGVSLFSSVFITAKSINFVVLGMLPGQVADSFQWLSWALAASVAGLVSLLLLMLLSSRFFRSDERPVAAKAMVQRQLEALGPVTSAEWGGLLAIGLLVLGVGSTSLHGIPPAWIAVSLMFVFLAIGTLGRKDFQRRLDWPFLFMLGTLIGFAKTLSYLGIDDMLAQHLGWLTRLLRDDIYLFVLALFGILMVLRMALSINAAVVVVAAVLLPIADQAGVNAWVVGFMVLMLAEGFVMPYQCSYYLSYQSQNRELRLYDERLFLRFNLWSLLIRLAAVYASIPFWQMLGILR